VRAYPLTTGYLALVTIAILVLASLVDLAVSANGPAARRRSITIGPVRRRLRHARAMMIGRLRDRLFGTEGGENQIAFANIDPDEVPSVHWPAWRARRQARRRNRGG
jgi:hypothetical protein